MSGLTVGDVVQSLHDEAALPYILEQVEASGLWQTISRMDAAIASDADACKVLAQPAPFIAAVCIEALLLKVARVLKARTPPRMFRLFLQKSGAFTLTSFFSNAAATNAVCSALNDDVRALRAGDAESIGESIGKLIDEWDTDADSWALRLCNAKLLPRGSQTAELYVCADGQSIAVSGCDAVVATVIPDPVDIESSARFALDVAMHAKDMNQLPEWLVTSAVDITRDDDETVTLVFDSCRSASLARRYLCLTSVIASDVYPLHQPLLAAMKRGGRKVNPGEEITATIAKVE